MYELREGEPEARLAPTPKRASADPR